jgi:hypothetical protein
MSEEETKKVLNGNDELSEDADQLNEVDHDNLKKPNLLNEVYNG